MQIQPSSAINGSGSTACPHYAGMAVIAGASFAIVLIQMIPGWSEALQWKRGGSLLGYLTGHFTHWSWNHLIWDLATFATLTYAALKLIPARLIACLIMASIVVPLEIALNQAQFDTYRGLSGIGSALFGLTLAGLWNHGRTAKTIATISFVGFVGKSTYELCTGSTFFVEQAQYDFIPAYSAHISGILTGLAIGLIPKCSRKQRAQITRRYTAHLRQ